METLGPSSILLRRISLTLALLLTVLAISGLALGQNIAGAYHHVRDSDGSHPKKGATITLTFAGGLTGSLKMLAVQPGETEDDTGTYSIQGSRITIHFKEMEWESDRQAFEFDGCTLTLPFKALSGSSGPGTSTWRRQDPSCPEQPGQASVNPSTGKAGTTAPAPASTAGRAVSFSAEEVIGHAQQSRRAKIWVSDLGFRSEGAENGPGSVTILRRDRNLLWAFSPQARTFTETPFDLGSGGASTDSIALEPGCQVAGQETVSGYLCRKEVCRTSVGGQNYSETRWAAQELSWFIIKYTSGTSTMLIENIKLGPQDSRMFEVPAGYAKAAQ